MNTAAAAAAAACPLGGPSQLLTGDSGRVSGVRSRAHAVGVPRTPVGGNTVRGAGRGEVGVHVRTSRSARRLFSTPLRPHGPPRRRRVPRSVHDGTRPLLFDFFSSSGEDGDDESRGRFTSERGEKTYNLGAGPAFRD